METLDQNEEHGRVKTGRRKAWAKALVRPQTLKMAAAIGKWIILVLKLVHAILRIFRD